MPYPNNAERLAKEQHVSIFKVIGLTRPGFEPTRFESPDLPFWEIGGFTLLILPFRLVNHITSFPNAQCIVPYSRPPMINAPDAVAKLVRLTVLAFCPDGQWARKPGQVKPMTYQIDTFHYLAWCSE